MIFFKRVFSFNPDFTICLASALAGLDNNGVSMKSSFITIGFLVLSLSQASASFPDKRFPGKISICPERSIEMLEIAYFLPSANSDTTKGICIVNTQYYSWWEHESSKPTKIEVQTACDSNDFVQYKGKKMIQSEVSYKGEVSMCDSSHGCFYECRPQVSTSPF